MKKKCFVVIVLLIFASLSMFFEGCSNNISSGIERNSTPSKISISSNSTSSEIEKSNSIPYNISNSNTVSSEIKQSNSTPSETVNDFFNNIKNNNLDKAKAYLVKGDTTLEFTSEGNKNVLKKVFAMNSYDILSTNITNNSAIVKVKIISPNVEELTTRMLSEVMKQLKNTIDNGETIEEDTGKVAEEYYYKMLDDPNVEKITSEVNVDLVREGDKWLIKGNKEFKNAITGNMSRAASN